MIDGGERLITAAKDARAQMRMMNRGGGKAYDSDSEGVQAKGGYEEES